jgi:hypothetical protein
MDSGRGIWPLAKAFGRGLLLKRKKEIQFVQYEMNADFVEEIQFVQYEVNVSSFEEFGRGFWPRH